MGERTPAETLREAAEELRDPEPIGLAGVLYHELRRPLAALLRAEADIHEGNWQVGDVITCPDGKPRKIEVWLASTLPQALAVAQVILGESDG